MKEREERRGREEIKIKTPTRAEQNERARPGPRYAASPSLPPLCNAKREREEKGVSTSDGFQARKRNELRGFGSSFFLSFFPRRILGLGGVNILLSSLHTQKERRRGRKRKNWNKLHVFDNQSGAEVGCLFFYFSLTKTP